MKEEVVPAQQKGLNRSLIFALMLGLFVSGLDGSVVNIMLPKLHEVFAAPLPKTMFIATIYLALMAAFQLLAGRCADIFNSLAVFLFGLILFFAGSLVCAISLTIEQIICGRGIQGVGAAMLAASFGAIILTYVPREKTGSVIGAVMMVMSLGVIIGPPLGGFLAEHVSWHWAFLINLPITAVSIGIISKYLINNKAGYLGTDLRESLKSLDLKGAIYSIIMLIALPAIFSLGSDKGLDSPFFLGAVIIFLVSGALFSWTENRVAKPLMQLSILKNAGLVLILFIKGLVFVVMNGVMLVFPFFITGSSDMTIAQAGMFLLISAAAMAVTTPIAGKMTDRFQEIHLVLIAAFVLLFVIIGAFFIGAVPSKIIMGIVLAGFGCAMAVLMVATSVLILKQAPAGQEGIFSALNSLVLPVAGSVGVALFASIYAHGESVGSLGNEAYSGFILSLQSILVCILLLFVATIFYTLLIQRKQKTIARNV